MNETTREWHAKAEGDFRTASRELDAVDAPNYDAVCFHAQQCAEKLMKAILISHGSVPPRSHDLAFLLDRLKETGILLDIPRDEFHFLTRAAVEFRYPGEAANVAEAREALRICAQVREGLLEHLES